MSAPFLASSIAVLPLPPSVKEHAIIISASDYSFDERVFSPESASRCEKLITRHFNGKPYMAIVLANEDDVIRLGQDGTIFMADSKAALMRAVLRFDLLGKIKVVWVDQDTERQRDKFNRVLYSRLINSRELLNKHGLWSAGDEERYQCHLKEIGGGQWQLRGMPAIKERDWQSPAAPAIKNFNLSQREVEDIFLAQIYDWLQFTHEEKGNGIGLTIEDPITGYTLLTELWRCQVEERGRLCQELFYAEA